MIINKVINSRISKIDFNNLDFGEIFTDHMFVCDYENGKWLTPEIVPYGKLNFYPSLSVFHYGQAIFEGMKAFKDNNGDVYMFRPEENFIRFNKSSKRLCIPEFPKEYFFNGLEKLLYIDRDWIKPGKGNSLYIRPFVISSQNGVQAAPSNKYKFMIICTPVKSYYSGKINVLIEQKFSRAASGGVGYAKAAGNYAAQFYPTDLAQKKGYQQIIWTDSNNHDYLEEAGTMNIFYRINDTLITTPNNDTILDGITRKSVIKICKFLGIKIEVRSFSVNELIEAQNNKTLKEIFGAGTAVVILPISGFSFNETHYEIIDPEKSTATMLKDKIMDIQYNLSEDPFGWRYKVPSIYSLK